VTVADWTWVGLIGVAVGLDVVYAKTHQELLTTSARKHRLIAYATLAVLALHFADVLGPIDPFRAVGHLIG
jgi:hypothetical protein